MLAPLLGAITLDQTGGGIAVVSNLLWRVLVSQWGTDARLVTVFDHENRAATFSEKARFALAVAGAQLLGRTDWLVFSHLALARTQRIIPAARRRPYGVFLHGIEAWTPLNESQQHALAQADLRIANSRYTATRVMKAHPTIGPIESCPLALPPLDGSAPSSRGTESPFALGAHAVLIVGRMLQSERYKGHDQLIDAWPQVVARVPDAQLVIVGDGDDAPRLKQKAADQPGGQRVIFTGFVSAATLSSLYEQSALFALPSAGEGFGLVYLEAMTHRLACVGSIHDAASEIIVDGVTGRLVDQSNVANLAEAVAGLLLDEPRRRAMGEAGHKRAVTDFSFDAFSKRLCELLGVAERRHRRSVD